MDEKLEKYVEETFGNAVFVPSHFTRALVATGVAIGAGGISAIATAYALRELKRTTVEEIAAMIKPPSGG